MSGRRSCGRVRATIVRPSGRLRPSICRPPFAVAAVEHQDGFAGGKPQHVAQIIALVALQRDLSRPRARGRRRTGEGRENRVQACVMFRFAPAFSLTRQNPELFLPVASSATLCLFTGYLVVRSKILGRRFRTLVLAGETPLMIRRLIVPLIAAVVTILAGQAYAQSAFPAPLPNRAVRPCRALRHFRR